MHTSNGGKNWDVQYEANETTMLSKIRSLDANKVWAIGKTGTGDKESAILLKTTDGMNWETILNSPDGDLKSVFVSSTAGGWAVGRHGEIWHALPNSDNWKMFSRGSTKNLKAVCFVDGQNGWAIGKSILKTNDAGKTWEEQPFVGTENQFRDLFFTDPRSGWIVGEDGLILHTNDHGQKWHAQNRGTVENLNSVYFIIPRIGWAVGENGTILYTSDGGESWTAKRSPTHQHLNTVTFIDNNTGWISGDKGVIFKTNDAGKTWIQQASSTVDKINDLKMLDYSNGWAVAEDGSVLHTVNGGASWFKETVAPGISLNAVGFVNSNETWVVGNEGTILYKTGKSLWQLKSSGTVNNLYDICLSDNQNAWVVGDYGSILQKGSLLSEQPILVDKQEVSLNYYQKGLAEEVMSYPNPFSDKSTIAYTLNKNETIVLHVYSINGQLVSTLVNETQAEGMHTVVFNANDLPNGVYIYVLNAGQEVRKGKMILAR
jgi:photosystem II stability/assembly factor-like uncharacterized protein